MFVFPYFIITIGWVNNVYYNYMVIPLSFAHLDVVYSKVYFSQLLSIFVYRYRQNIMIMKGM